MFIAPQASPCPEGANATFVSETPIVGSHLLRHSHDENLRLLLAASEAEIAMLAPREREVVMAFHRGLSTAEIATETGMSQGTVCRKISGAARRLRRPSTPLPRVLRRQAIAANATCERIDSDNAARLRGLPPEALAILTPALAEVAALADRRLSTPEIAAELRIPLATVRVRISQAIARLMKHGRDIHQTRSRPQEQNATDRFIALGALSIEQLGQLTPRQATAIVLAATGASPSEAALCMGITVSGVQSLIRSIEEKLGLAINRASRDDQTARSWLAHVARPEQLDCVTPAQRRVIDGLRRGMSDDAIADALGIVQTTVHHHLMSARARAEGATPKIGAQRAERIRERRITMLSAMARGVPASVAAAAVGILSSGISYHLGAMRSEAGVDTTIDLIKRALDLGIIPDPGPIPLRGLTPTQKVLVPLLARATPDATILKRLGISQHSLHGRLKRMLDVLRTTIGLPPEATLTELRYRMLRRSEKVIVRASPDARTLDRRQSLSQLDQEVARLVRERVSNPDIRAQLGLSERALKATISRLRSALGPDALGPRRSRRKGEHGQVNQAIVRKRLFALDRSAIAAAGLTPRQDQIIRMTLFGLTTQDICNTTGLAIPTVLGHRTLAYRRLGITR